MRRLGVLLHDPGQAVFIQHLHIGIGVELIGRVDALPVPLTGEHHSSADHGRNARRIGNSLAAELLIALLMIAYVVNVIYLVLAVLFALEDTTDICLTLCSWTE